MITLVNILTESHLTDHYKDRKAERGTITDIELPKAAYGEYNVEEAKQKIIQALQSKLDSQLSEIESKDYKTSNTYNVGVCALLPILISDGKKHGVKMITGEGAKDGGTIFLVIIMDEALITMYPTTASSQKDIEAKIDEHTKREHRDNNKEAKALIPQSSVYEIDLDELFGKEKEKEQVAKTPMEDLDYKVRTDYRVGATFSHKQYGDGEIVATSSGSKGVGDARGVVDWIKVKYKKPFLKGGKLENERIFKGLYTTIYYKQ